MTFTVLTNWTPGAAKAAGAAGSVLGGGWIDPAGSTWSINGSNQCVSAYFALGSGPNHLLIRPSSESAIDSQIQVTFIYEDGTDGPILYGRASGTVGSTFQAYAALVVAGGVLFGADLAGTFGSSILGSQAFPWVVGRSYSVTFGVVQFAPLQTGIAVTIVDNSTSISYGPYGVFDTAASALQNAVGVCAIQDNRSSSGATADLFTNLITYTDAVAATGYAVTGPTGGSPATPSSAFTVISNGILTSAVRVTPNDNGAGGTFTPAYVTLAAGTDTSGTFTYTPASAAAIIAFTNNGGLTNPASLPYEAPTWVAVSTGTVSGGPTTPGAPGSIVWNGWIDEEGVWNIDSSQQLQTAYSASNYLLNVIQRPPQEATVDLKCVVTFNALDITQNATTLFVAHRRSVTDSNKVTAYLVGVGAPGVLSIDTIVANGIASLASAATGAFVANHSLTLTTSFVQINSTTTLIIASLYDNTAAALLGTVSSVDTTSVLQNIAGVATIQQNQANSGDVANPPTAIATYTDLGVANTYAVTGPNVAAPGVPSALFTISATGSLAANVVVTPSDNGAGGTFTPASRTLTSGAFPRFNTFTYTPAAAGNVLLSFGNNGGLANPQPRLLQVYTLANVPVTSPAFGWSPFNWRGDTLRAGSIWRQSWCNSADAVIQWTASAFPVASLLLNQSNPTCTNVLTISMNDQLTAGIPATGPIDLTLLTGFAPGAPNTAVVRLQTSIAEYRWNSGINTVRIAGLSLDSSSTPGVAAPNPPESSVPTIGTVLIVGDSLTEGSYADNGTANALCAWPFFVAQTLGAEGYRVGTIPCANRGWLEPGDIGFDVPAWYSVTNGVYSPSQSGWNLIDEGVSLLDANGQYSAYGGTGQTPAAIIINLGTNEAFYTLSTSDMQISIVQWLLSARAAAPLAKIFLCVPFSMECTLSQCTFQFNPAYAATVKAAYAAYKVINAADSAMFLIDLGQAVALRLETNGSPLQYQATSHWLTAGHALLASLISPILLEALAPTLTPLVPNEYIGKSASVYG